MERYEDMSLEELLRHDDFACGCGKRHAAGIERVLIGSGALRELPALIRGFGCARPFVLADRSTDEAAGRRVRALLREAGLECSFCVMPEARPAPDERTVGGAVMHFDRRCDLVLGVGSGVVNDTGKILAGMTGLPYVVAATAPSMDGYASATSSMERDGLKVSLDSAAARAIVGDLDVLCAAPERMLLSGVGDMVAKYVSLCEWRLSTIVTDEYYCPVVAGVVENALKKCVSAAPGLRERRPEAVRAVMEGLVAAGMAMHYAGVSRPASGMEHYFSHIWDMRALAFGTPSDLHGIQCGVGTLLSLRCYEFARRLTPDRGRARAAAARFSPGDWNARLRAFIGPGAEAMIEGERREGKYDPARREARAERIVERWPELCAVMDTLPPLEEVRALLAGIGAPTTPEELGISREDARTTFTMTKDIRDKYVLSRLLWDLGELDRAAAECF